MSDTTATAKEIELREKLLRAVIAAAKDGMHPHNIFHAFSAAIAGTLAMYHLNEEQAKQTVAEIGQYAVASMVTYMKKENAKRS